jgi:ankyrin repeat protein
MEVEAMADETPGAALSLPDEPDLEWLRKQAKRRLAELREASGDARLAEAQFDLAKRYGFTSWRALKAHVDASSLEGRLFAAARSGDVRVLAVLLDEHPEKLGARTQPYELTLLHLAAQSGREEAVELLLARGLDVNARDKGDNSYPMHWAAAAGHLDVVRQLADAGGDVVGRGDDHELEVIGWATCWDGDDERQQATAQLLVSLGARHHVFSAVALGLEDEVRWIVAADPGAVARRMSRHENSRQPLHLAAARNRSTMVRLLLELGADPSATDGLGATVSVYASAPEVDREVIEVLRERGALDVFGALALGDEETASRLLAEGREAGGALHLAAKRGDERAVRWLLERGTDPNAYWAHWDADVTPLHLAAQQGHVEIVRLLLDAGADPGIRDSKHDGDARGWAEHGRVPPARRWREVAELLDRHVAG